VTENLDDYGLIELGRVAGRRNRDGDIIPINDDWQARMRELTEPRLVRVRDQLLNDDRRTPGAYQFQTVLDARSFPPDIKTAEERQFYAMMMLFTAACEQPTEIITAAEREGLPKRLRWEANLLRETVKRLQKHGLRQMPFRSREDRIVQEEDPWIITADELEAEANRLDRDVALIGRDRAKERHNTRARAIWLGRWCQYLFGGVLPGVVSPLIEVVEGQGVEDWQIAGWVKGSDEIDPKGAQEISSRSKQAAVERLENAVKREHPQSAGEE
jgi:hypothetical protein